MRINKGKHNGPRGSYAVPSQYHSVIDRAIALLQAQVAQHPCTSFGQLPGGQSFQSLLASELWINYDPSNKYGFWGWTSPATHPKDIVVSQYCCRMGRWSLVGTIVHEMAHLNGAPGGFSHAAEETLKGCGLQSPDGPYDPNVLG